MPLSFWLSSKRRIAAENADLIRVVGDLDCNLTMMMKAKSSMQAQLEEIKANADSESRERSLLLGKFRNLEHEVDIAKEALDEETASRDNVLRQVSKAEGDAALWRAKYENEAVSSSRASFAISTSCSRLRNFPRSRDLSLDSLSAFAVVSSSWACMELLAVII